MKQQSAASRELCAYMRRKGYPDRFCERIAQELHTEFTARRMIGYLSHFLVLPMEEVVDEMLSILSDRDRIMEKKSLEQTNIAINRLLNDGLDADKDNDEE